ncbi:MAG: hypothetical protein KBB86_01050 [Candidatus Pacebacteria bacterium]|nr:hypothetical protein [Candidatus Paceibacterota bacterium]
MNNSPLENGPEQFPSKEEIASVFESILKGKEYTEVRFESDDNGISLYEIEVTLEDGFKVEYNYQKATYDYKNPAIHPNLQFSASIQSIEYDEDGMPCGGEGVANYRDGAWIYLK